MANLRQSYAALVGLAGSAANAITVVDPATPPAQPSSPRVLLNTLLAAIVGLLIALGIAFALEYLDDTVKSSQDVEAVTGLPTLGTIIKMKSEKGRSEIYHLATLALPARAGRGGLPHPAHEPRVRVRGRARPDAPGDELHPQRGEDDDRRQPRRGLRAGRPEGDPPGRGPAQARRRPAVRPAERSGA